MEKENRWDTHRLTGTALLAAVVIILQLLGSFIRFGPFSVSLVAVPIVVGAAIYGAEAGVILGLAFAAAVLLSGSAAPFFAVDAAGTLFTVIIKGIACGAAAGWTYKLLAAKHRTLAVIAAAFVCPVVNTGVFLLGCCVFFLPILGEWAQGMGFGSNIGAYMILGLVGGNFLFEVITNMLLCPVILRLIHIGGKRIR